MKKTFSFSLMAVAFIATLILAGCQKDANILRVRIDNFGGNGKVYIGGTNSNVPTWNSGDIIWIDHCDASNPNNHSYTLNEFNSRGEALLTLPNYPSYCALYPYDLGTVAEGTTTASITIPQVQRYTINDDGAQVVNAPMAACTLNDPNGSISFHNLGALLAITIECNILTHTSMVVDEVRVTSESGYPLWGSTTVDISDPNAIFDFRPATSAAQCTIYLRKFNSSNQQEPLFSLSTTATTTTPKKKTVYVYVPAIPSGVNNKYTIEVVAHNGNDDLSRSYTQASNTGGNLPRNTMANVEFLMRPLVAPTGAVPDGRFTIDAAGHQVYFAAGNLQYRRSDNTWRIAPNQYDLIGGSTTSSSWGGNVSGSTNNGIGNSSYTGWIDLFGWATSGYHNTDDNGCVRYQPYDFLSLSVSATDGDPNNNLYGYGPSANHIGNSTSYVISRLNVCDLDGDNANYDWGVYHSNVTANVNANRAIIQYGSGPVGSGAVWRTLTVNEWEYLLKTRDFNGDDVPGGKGEHYSWSGVTCNGVEGILIYPDGYTLQLTSTSNDHATIESVPSRCVFLPCAGYRKNASMNSSKEGYYWSSSGQTSNKSVNAYFLRFNVKNTGEAPSITVPTSDYRYNGCAVRLVTPVI